MTPDFLTKCNGRNTIESATHGSRYFEDYKLSDPLSGKHTDYAANFLPYIGFAAQIPNLLLNWINIFIPMGFG
ncbi:hypothetical protein C0J52_22626 [Blattella germanica]|nr:hypothetical protein C0J52_22626 [Blattella germanica]